MALAPSSSARKKMGLITLRYLSTEDPKDFTAMDKYRKVIKPKKESEEKDETEIRVTAVGSVSAYVSRAGTVFNELKKPFITITGTGNAIAKAVTLAEVVKRRIKGLHQITSVTSTEIVDEYEPIEEGLDNVTQTRNMSCISIKLSKDALDTSDKGYQPPLDESEVKEMSEEDLTKPRGRRRGRGRGKGGPGRSTAKSAEDLDADMQAYRSTAMES